MQQSEEEIFSARDFGYCLAGLSGLRIENGENIPEVQSIMQELSLLVSRSEFQGQPDLLFLQFGKSIRVKSGATTKIKTENLLYLNKIK